MTQLHLQQFSVPGADLRDALGIPGVGVSRGHEQLGHDLRVGLAVEAHALECGHVADQLREGLGDRPAPGPGRQQEGAVDIEEDESPGHVTAMRRTATRRSRSAVALPSVQRSRTTAPSRTVEWTMV